MSLYTNYHELIKSTNEDFDISGIMEVTLENLINGTDEDFEEMAFEFLAGNYSEYLYNFRYHLVGCDTVKEIIYIKVIATVFPKDYECYED